MAGKNSGGNRITVAGFELADVAAYGTVSVSGAGAVTVATDHVRTGTQALKCVAATAERALLATTFWVAAVTRFFFRGYLYLTAYPTAARLIWVANTVATSTRPEIRLNANGTLSLVSGTSPSSATVYGTSATAVPLSTWTRIEIAYDNTIDKCCVRIDGVTVIDWVSVVAAASIQDIAIGVLDTQAQAGAGALTLWWDDVAMDANDWCGPGEVHHVDIDAIEVSTGWSVVNAADFLAALNKSTADDTSYAQGPASTAGIRWSLAALPSGVARGIGVYTRWQRASASATQLRPIYGVNYASAFISTVANTAIAASTVWAWNRFAYNAWTGGLWSDARLRGGSFGISSASALAILVSLSSHEVDIDTSPFPDDGPSGRVYIENFEAGQLSPAQAVVGTAGISTVQKRSGSYAARINPAGATASYITLPIALSPPMETFFRAYVYVAARPASGSIRLMGISPVSAGQEISAFMTSTGAVSVSGGSASAANTIPLNTWTLVELRTARSATNGSGSDIELFVEGVSKSLGTNVSQSAAVAMNPTLGNTVGTNMTGVDIYFDDIIIDTVQSVGGDSEIILVMPDATTSNGAVTGDSHPTGGLTFHAMTDEIPHDGDTTYFGLGLTNSASIYYELGFPDSTEDDDFVAIRAIQHQWVIRSALGTMSHASAQPSYGESTVEAVQANVATGGTYTGRAAIIALQEHRGRLDVDSLNATLLRLRSADATDEPYVTQVAMLYEVEVIAVNPNSVGGNQVVIVG